MPKTTSFNPLCLWANRLEGTYPTSDTSWQDTKVWCSFYIEAIFFIFPLGLSLISLQEKLPVVRSHPFSFWPCSIILRPVIQGFLSFHLLLDKQNLTFSQIQVNSCHLLAREASTTASPDPSEAANRARDIPAFGTTPLLAVSFKCWRTSLKEVGFGDTMQKGCFPAAELVPHRYVPFPVPFHHLQWNSRAHESPC